MPGEVVNRPNPPPQPSHLPDHVLDLVVKPEPKELSKEDVKALEDFQSAACYIAAGKSPVSPVYTLPWLLVE